MDVGSLVIPCVTEAEVEFWKLRSLEYVAVMTSAGKIREVVLHVAWFEISATVPHPGMVPLEVEKLTVPAGGVGLNPAVDASVATKLTEVSTAGDDVGVGILSVVGAGVTACGTVLELAETKLVSAAMLALIEYDPAGSALVPPGALVVQAAVRVGPAPGTSGTEVHPEMGVLTPLSVELKLTAPLGLIPVLGVTATVKVTELFTVDGDPDVVSVKAGVPWVMVSVPVPDDAV